MRVLTAILFALCCVPAVVCAQLRPIPDDAIKAKMQPPRDGVAEVGKYVFRLAPGALIRTPDNRIVLPVMIGSGQLVRYQLDANGDLFRVWILSPEEDSLPAPKQ